MHQTRNASDQTPLLFAFLFHTFSTLKMEATFWSETSVTALSARSVPIVPLCRETVGAPQPCSTVSGAECTARKRIHTSAARPLQIDEGRVTGGDGSASKRQPPWLEQRAVCQRVGGSCCPHLQGETGSNVMLHGTSLPLYREAEAWEQCGLPALHQTALALQAGT